MSWDLYWRIDGASLDDFERVANDLLRTGRHPNPRAPAGGVSGTVTREPRSEHMPEVVAVELRLARELVWWDSPPEQRALLGEIGAGETSIGGHIRVSLEDDQPPSYLMVSVNSASANRYSWSVTTAIAEELVRRLGGRAWE